MPEMTPDLDALRREYKRARRYFLDVCYATGRRDTSVSVIEHADAVIAALEQRVATLEAVLKGEEGGAG